MHLTSIYYLTFLVVVATLYYTVNPKWRICIIILSSLFFYYMNQKLYVALLITSILINYFGCELWLKYRNRATVYGLVLFNLSVLAFFKYLPTILFGNQISQHTWWANLLLPIGISFYTFQAIGYALDLYWKNAKAQSPFLHFAMYMSFFPQLLSGPIARSHHFFPQITRDKKLSPDNITNSMRLIMWGLFKKIVIANNLSPYTSAVFENIGMHSRISLMLAAIAYAIQLYADFSGYTDIAIGSAKAFGYDLLINFRSPFRATSVTDFWRRWHISLSTWARDYLNSPLQYALRARGVFGVMIALFITFLAIGVWHGATWNFVVFGLVQGVIISFEYLTVSRRKALWNQFPDWASIIISRLLVFGFFVFSFALFRVSSMSHYLQFVGGIINRGGGLYTGNLGLLFYAFVGFIVWIAVGLVKKENHFIDFVDNLETHQRWLLYYVCTVMILLIGSFRADNFIYFQY